MSIENGNINIVRSLLNSGYLPDVIYNIQMYINSNYSLDMIQLFIDHGYDVNKKDYNGDTPLINLLYNYRKKTDKNYIKMFEIFIDAGADTTIQNNSNEDFYDILINMDFRTQISKSLSRNMLNIIKIKKPDQYEYYLTKEDAKKYNL